MPGGQPAPNPSTQRGHPSAPGASIIARRGPLLAATVAVGIAAYLFAANRPPQAEGTPIALGKTQGVSNVEDAYKNAGATSTHTKAYGGTPMGKRDDESLREHAPAGTATPKGFDSDKYGHDQRPNDTYAVEDRFRKMNYGNQKGT